MQSWALATTRRRARPVQRRSSPPAGGRIRDHRCHFRRTGMGRPGGVTMPPSHAFIRRGVPCPCRWTRTRDRHMGTACGGIQSRPDGKSVPVARHARTGGRGTGTLPGIRAFQTTPQETACSMPGVGYAATANWPWLQLAMQRPQRTTSTGRGDFSGRQHSPTGSGVAAHSLSSCLTKVQSLLRSFHETANLFPFISNVSIILFV